MCRVEANPCDRWAAGWACGLPAPGACPGGGLHEHRLADRPVLNTLLEHVPGDVPYSTHLELEAARARLVHRTLGEALEQIGGRGPDYGRLAAMTPQPTAAPRPTAPSLRLVPPPPREAAVVAYTLPRRRWPVGGLIDLVI